MLLVVVGAGASKDVVNPSIMSLPDEWRPPLAQELFSNRPAFNQILLKEFAVALPAVQHLRERVTYGSYVEDELAALIKQADDYPQLHKELLAIKFYIQSIISRCSLEAHRAGFTNFVSLVRQLDFWRASSAAGPVLYVTFNYDTLIEHGLEMAAEWPIKSLDDYVSGDRAKLFKLHGSVNWWHEVERPPTQRALVTNEQDRRALIEAAADIKPADEVTVMAKPGTVVPSRRTPAWERGVLLYPAIAVPVERKPRFECPSDHVAELRSLLPNVDRVLFIGWRGREHLFLELLRTQLGPRVRGHVVSSNPESAEKVRVHLQTETGISEWAGVSGEGFSSFVAERAAQALLVPS